MIIWLYIFSPELLLIFKINNEVIKKDKSSKYNFSFLVRNAIQEILIELKIISSIEITKNVVIRNDRCSESKKFFDKLARIKKTSIVLKYILVFFA